MFRPRRPAWPVGAWPVGLLGAGLLLGLAAAGYAASMAVSSDGIGSATVATPRCTGAGLTVLQNLSGSSVVSVTVGGLPVACAGADVQATVRTGATESGGSGTVPAGGGSVTVILGSGVAVGTAEAIDVVVTGP